MVDLIIIMILQSLSIPDFGRCRWGYDAPLQPMQIRAARGFPISGQGTYKQIPMGIHFKIAQ